MLMVTSWAVDLRQGPVTLALPSLEKLLLRLTMENILLVLDIQLQIILMRLMAVGQTTSVSRVMRLVMVDSHFPRHSGRDQCLLLPRLPCTVQVC